jgi:hypothetical protein
MSVLKRKYNEEIPDSAKYKTPQASIPSRRTQIKIHPDGKTSFGPNEIIRIIVPPQGYFDPEFSYLSFDVRLTAPESYKMKALEVWNSHSTACLYDIGLAGIVAAGKGQKWSAENAKADPSKDSSTAADVIERSKAVPIPLFRQRQTISSGIESGTTVTNGNGGTLTFQEAFFEWIPVGHLFPVLPFSSHGFFNRVVIRTANNTPIEDIQDYDYLCAHLGQLLQSEGYTSTMGAMLEGWGDVNQRAKLGLSCVQNLRFISPLLASDNYDRAGMDGQHYYTSKYGNYSDLGNVSTFVEGADAPVNGLSPEGILDSTLKETVGGVKLTCNLNLGLLQQRQNLPLLFSGGLILELYTAPFERCMSFTTIFSKPDATDMPERFMGRDSNAEIVDITAMDCKLPASLTSILKLNPESLSLDETGLPLDETGMYYHKTGYSVLSGTYNKSQEWRKHMASCANQAYLCAGTSAPGRASSAKTGSRTMYDLQLSTVTPTAEVTVPQSTATHVQKNAIKLEDRYNKWLSGWTYQLVNVELRADMVQFSQSYDESVAAIVDSDEGLPITFQTFSVQKMTYNGQRETLTMNERARSIQFALAVFKEPQSERKTHEIFIDNDSKYYICGDFNLPVYESSYRSSTTEYSHSWMTGGPADHLLNTAATYSDTFKNTPTTVITDTTFQTTMKDAEIVKISAQDVTNEYYEVKNETDTGAPVFVYKLRRAPQSNHKWGSDVIGAAINFGYYYPGFVAVTNGWRSFMRILPVEGQSQSIFPSLIDYQFRIGTRFIPASPVDCSSGGVQAYIELLKAIGMYGSFSGDGRRALMPGHRITPDLYTKRICTAESKLLTAAYSQSSSKRLPGIPQGQYDCKDYAGSRYRIPTRFILGQNFSDIPDHASGVDTATQALSVELSLNGNVQQSGTLNCYVFMNVRRDLFIRCGGQIEILY